MQEKQVNNQLLKDDNYKSKEQNLNNSKSNK